jgi:hypothetical protein
MKSRPVRPRTREGPIKKRPPEIPELASPGKLSINPSKPPLKSFDPEKEF